MKASLVRCADASAAALEAARHIARHMETHPGALITLAAGFTPLSAYAELIRISNGSTLELTSMRYVGLDEWVSLGPDDRGSCIQTINDAFYIPAGIPRANIRVFDGLAEDPRAEAEAMDAYLAASGGLSLAVLGIGLNGHVGFNEPGRALSGRFSLTLLSPVTTSVGRKYFGGKPAPVLGATITLGALMAAREVILIATGAHKREIVRAVLAGEDVPAAAFLNHPNATYIFDKDCYPAD
ncbi:MAG TPA: 6-phosphogluconolactonase [Clostridia bacterium]|nr:6-phosphogluconolactonase [Clostridia bacterium]